MFGFDGADRRTEIDRPMKYFIMLHWSVSLCRRLRAVQIQTFPARSPLSVTGFAPSATECPESSSEGQPNLTYPPAFVRERPKAGGFKHIEMGPRICASKAQMPHPSGGYLRNLLRRAGSLGLPLFVLFSSEDEKSTPKANPFSRNIIQHSSKQKPTQTLSTFSITTFTLGQS